MNEAMVVTTWVVALVLAIGIGVALIRLLLVAATSLETRPRHGSEPVIRRYTPTAGPSPVPPEDPHSPPTPTVGIPRQAPRRTDAR